MMLILFGFILSFTAHAATGNLNSRITNLEELQRKISSQCLNNPNRAQVQVVINGKTLTCDHLIILANRLKQQLQTEITELKESCEPQAPSPQRDLAGQVARAAGTQCQVKSTDSQCLPLYTCAALTMTNPLLTLIGGVSRLRGDRSSCLSRGAAAAPGCLQNVLKGVFDSLWGLVSLVWDIGKAAVRKFGEWTGLVRRAERRSSEKLMAAQQAGPGFIRRFISNPGQVMRQMASQMFEGIKQAAMSSYGCERWSGAPFVSRCLQPMTNWNCATCQQKLQLMCGVAGFAVGEIGTALLTGGLAAGARFVASAAKNAVIAGARSRRLSQLATATMRAIPRARPALARATVAVTEASVRTLTAAQRTALRAWDAIANSRITNAIGAAARAARNSPAGEALRFTLRPAAFYLNALDEATALGYRSVDNVLAGGAIRGADTVADVTRVAEASRPQPLPDIIDDVPAEARATVSIDDAEVAPVIAAAERDAGLADDLIESRPTSTTVLDDDIPSPSIRVADDTPTPAPVQPTRTPAAANDDAAIVLSSRTPEVPATRVDTSAITVRNGADNVLVVRPGGQSDLRLVANDNIPVPAAVRAAPEAPTTRIVSSAGELTSESTQRLRSAGLDPDDFIRPNPPRAEGKTSLAQSSQQRAREAEWTRTDLQGRFNRWAEEGVSDDIFRTLGQLGSEQEKRRYLAILLNSPKGQTRATLERLRNFRNIRGETAKADYFRDFDRRVAGLDRELEAAEALPAGLERAERIAALSRQRSAYLQERTILMGGDDLEVVNIFTSRAGNQDYRDVGKIPHSLEDSFSVDLRIKQNTSVCRGSYAGPVSTSNLAGNFLTFCRDTGYNDRRGLERNLAAPGDRTRVGRDTQGYERFNRFELEPGDQITLGLNGPVRYSDEGMLGTGGTGGGVELFAYRSPTNPISLDRLRGSARVASCSRGRCDEIFSIRESVNPRVLANQSQPDRYLADRLRATNGVISRMDSRFDEYVASLSRQPDPNLTRFREEFSDLDSALALRREIELKQRTPVGALDSESQALIDYTRTAESLGEGVAAQIRAQGITDPATIERMFREAIDNSSLARNHADNVRFIEEGTARLRAGNLTDAERNDLLYQLATRANQEADLGLAFKTLEYKAGQAAGKLFPAKSPEAIAAQANVSGAVQGLQRNGLTVAPPLDPRITPALRRAAALGDFERVEEAARVAGRTLTRAEQDAVLRAHGVGEGTGRGFFTYTRTDLSEKTRILRQAGFSEKEATDLLREGITGSLPATQIPELNRLQAATRDISRNTRGVADIRMRDLNYPQSMTADQINERLEDARRLYDSSGRSYASVARSPQGTAEDYLRSIDSYARSGNVDEAYRVARESGAKVRPDALKADVQRNLDDVIARRAENPRNPELGAQEQNLRNLLARIDPSTAPRAPAALPVTPARREADFLRANADNKIRDLNGPTNTPQEISRISSEVVTTYRSAGDGYATIARESGKADDYLRAMDSYTRAYSPEARVMADSAITAGASRADVAARIESRITELKELRRLNPRNTEYGVQLSSYEDLLRRVKNPPQVAPTPRPVTQTSTPVPPRQVTQPAPTQVRAPEVRTPAATQTPVPQPVTAVQARSAIKPTDYWPPARDRVTNAPVDRGPAERSFWRNIYDGNGEDAVTTARATAALTTGDRTERLNDMKELIQNSFFSRGTNFAEKGMSLQKRKNLLQVMDEMGPKYIDGTNNASAAEFRRMRESLNNSIREIEDAAP